MDPNTTMLDLISAIAESAIDRISETSEALRNWLVGGGFAPTESAIRSLITALDDSGSCHHGAERVLTELGRSRMCVECVVQYAASEGLCYPCSCSLHTLGIFDMDGTGWQ